MWFLFSLLLSGIITVLIPESVFSRYMGGGTGAIVILVLSVKPVWRFMRSRLYGPEPTRESLETDTTVVNALEPCAGST